MAEQLMHAVAITGQIESVYCYADRGQAEDAFDFAATLGAMDTDTVRLFAFPAPLWATPEQCVIRALRRLAIGRVNLLAIKPAKGKICAQS